MSAPTVDRDLQTLLNQKASYQTDRDDSLLLEVVLKAVDEATVLATGDDEAATTSTAVASVPRTNGDGAGDGPDETPATTTSTTLGAPLACSNADAAVAAVGPSVAAVSAASASAGASAAATDGDTDAAGAVEATTETATKVLYHNHANARVYVKYVRESM